MNRFIVQWIIIFGLYLTLSSPALAQAPNDLDDITIRVIGLDEVPTSSMQIIDLPEPDLGEMNDINEEIANSPDISDSVGNIVDVPGIGSGDSGPNTSSPE